MATTQTLVIAAYDDLQKFINEDYANMRMKAFLNRFDNVLIGTNDVAHIHSVNPRTVLNYIADGLIHPEAKVSEKDHHQFRLSYALTLDFKELQKQLRAKRKQW